MKVSLKMMKNKMKKINVTNVLVLVLCLLVLVLVYRMCFSKSEGMTTKSCEAFEDSVKSEDKKLALVYASWCGHCKKMKPEWEEASKDLDQSKDLMPSVDVGEGTKEDKELMKKYDIKGFPTILMFENGEMIGTFDKRDKKSFLEYFN